MVINGSCSTNMCARQLSFNFSSMVWGGAWPRGPPLDPPWLLAKLLEIIKVITEAQQSVVLRNIHFFSGERK